MTISDADTQSDKLLPKGPTPSKPEKPAMKVLVVRRGENDSHQTLQVKKEKSTDSETHDSSGEVEVPARQMRQPAKVIALGGAKPSAKPSTKPSAKPSTKPSAKPSTKPSEKPTQKPTEKPYISEKPTQKPTERPEEEPKPVMTPKPRVQKLKAVPVERQQELAKTSKTPGLRTAKSTKPGGLKTAIEEDEPVKKPINCLCFLYLMAIFLIGLFALPMVIAISAKKNGMELLRLLTMNQTDFVGNFPLMIIIITATGMGASVLAIIALLLHNRKLLQLYALICTGFMVVFVAMVGISANIALKGCKKDPLVMNNLREYYIDYQERDPEKYHFHQIVQCCGSSSPFDIGMRVTTPAWKSECEMNLGAKFDKNVTCNVPLSCCKEMKNRMCQDLGYCWDDLKACKNIFRDGCVDAVGWVYMNFPKFLCQWGAIVAVMFGGTAIAQLINIIMACD